MCLWCNILSTWHVTIGKLRPIDTNKLTLDYRRKPLIYVREKVTPASNNPLCDPQKNIIFFIFCIANSNIIRIFAVQTKLLT